VGVTGGIASGKSTVLAELGRLGAVTFSADAIARRIVEPGGPAYGPVRDAFGPSVLDVEGRIDRAALAARIFGDPESRKLLEALMHPIILKELGDEIAAFRAHPSNDPPVAAAEIPLLYEAGAESMVDVVLAVSAEPERQIARLKQRTPWPDSQIRAALDSQIPLSEKRARADAVVTTDGDLSDTLAQTRAFWDRITAR
jgi:dephospho-CoA kinase